MASRTGSFRAHRVLVFNDGADRAALYRDAFTIAVADCGGARSTGARSAEELARAVFEGAPALMRQFLLVGWRLGLGLRLGPRSSPEHVLGWQIEVNEPSTAVLRLDSTLMIARLTFHIEGSTLRLSSEVRYSRPAGRALWAVVAPLHRQLIPYLLKHAVAQHA